MGFLDLKYEVFGLNINDSSLKIIKLAKKRNGFVISSFGEIKINPGIVERGVIKDEDILAKIIKAVLSSSKGKKIKTKHVVASLPEEKSFLEVIKMPRMSNGEFEFSVPIEAENYIPLPIDQVYLDFEIISSSKERQVNSEILIVASPKKIVDSYISCFQKAGLITVALEPEAQSIFRAIVKNGINTGLIALINFGEDGTELVIVDNGATRFTCSIPISSSEITQSISQNLKIDFYEAERMKKRYGLTIKKSGTKAEKAKEASLSVLDNLVLQIEKHLNFYQDHSYDVESKKLEFTKILLCGGGSSLKGISDFLSKKLGIDVELGNPMVNLFNKCKNNSCNIIGKDLISYTTAIGLALRQADEDKKAKVFK
jgi:type IV pilus assembly protein PilM